MIYFPFAKSISIILLIGAPFIGQAQAGSTPALPDTSQSINQKNILNGIASYYHNKFEGRQMANGSFYRKDFFTAACNVLPLNKWIRVTNLVNNRQVVVKITDRMHPKNKRLVDLSYAAAKQLKMLAHGLIKVKIEVLEESNIEISIK